MAEYTPRSGRISQPDICDVFIKVGGSILDDADCTAELVPHLVEASRQCRVVMLCGGGRVAKRIGANQRSRGSNFYSSWKAGITSLDVHAGLLASHAPEFAVATSVHEIAERLAAGQIAVLAPAATIVSDLVMFPDYLVTTDSMGLYFANLLGARRYVVVSNVDGIYRQVPSFGQQLSPLPGVTPEDLEALPSSKLDPAFPAYYRRFPLPTLVVNGRYPARVADAIVGRVTTGTAVMLCRPAGASTAPL